MKVIIYSGIPGSGKSNHAKENYPDAWYCSADDFFIDENGVYRHDRRKLTAAHRECKLKFIQGLIDAQPVVVVDNTNITNLDIAPYAAFAEAFSYDVMVLTMVCDTNVAIKRNVHNVPAALIERQAERIKWRLQRPTHRWKETIIKT